jgi:hypothetical protein
MKETEQFVALEFAGETEVLGEDTSCHFAHHKSLMTWNAAPLWQAGTNSLIHGRAVSVVSVKHPSESASFS